MKDKKRGQITVFIVVGIIILFSVGLLLYVASIRPELRLFAPRESEIDQYIGSCLELTAEEAITLLGATGGYIDVPQNIKQNDKAYFSFGIRTEPRIPMWYYKGNFRIPLKSDFANNISGYVVENIDDCIGNFDILSDKFEFRKTGNTTVNTTIEQDRVFVQLDYPLDAKDRLTGVILSSIPIGRNIDVKLGKMYDMAIDILRTETKKLFFENLTIDLLSSGPDMPFTGMEFGCTPKQWRKSQLVDFAKNMIYYNMQQITVRGNGFILYNQNDAYARNNYVLDLSRQYPDINAAFLYPRTTRFDLHVRPNDRELMRSQVARPLGGGVFSALPICISTWHFTYDIDYPLLTTLNDESAFGGRGFVFNFAFPVTINHNKGDKTDFPLLLFEAPEFANNFCQTVGEKQVDIRVKDYFTLEDIYQAPIKFRCIRYECELGNTKSEGGVYRKLTKIPSACSGGSLISDPEGYLEGSAIYENTDYAEILVKPLKTFKVKFVKYDSNNINNTRNIESVDSVTLILTSYGDRDYNQIYVTNESNEIQLIEGDADYKIEALLVQEGEQLIGGYVVNWSVKYSDIAGKSEIIFPLLEIVPTPVTDDEQAQALDYIYNNISYAQKIKPAFS